MLQSSSSSTYPSSPVSTPSRVLHYTGVPPSTSTSTFVSSTSSINTPSPILSTYLGKRGGEYNARARALALCSLVLIDFVLGPFDGAFLTELRKHPDSDEEE